MAIRDIAETLDLRFSQVAATTTAGLRNLAGNSRLRRWVSVRGIVESRPVPPRLEMWAAGDDDTGGFAVCGAEGRVLWCGHRAAPPTWLLASTETVAAAKAVWLAGRVRADAGAAIARLRLHLVDPDIDRYALAVVAAKAGVLLVVDAVCDNPACAACDSAGQAVDWQVPDVLRPAAERAAGSADNRTLR